MSSACACKERECGKFHAHGAFCKQLPRTLASTDQDYLFALNRIPILAQVLSNKVYLPLVREPQVVRAACLI